MTNFRLHDEQTLNRLRKITWAIDIYRDIDKYFYIYLCISLYGKQKFVFLVRQMINGNRLALFQQMCPSMCTLYVGQQEQYIHERRRLGCFRKCHFGIPRNTEFYTELVLFRVIPRNSAKFFTVQFRGISRNSAEFRVGSFIRNSVYLQMKIQLLKILMYFVVKGTVARDLPPFHRKYPSRSMIHILS